MGSQLGANPEFDFSVYDAQHDVLAMTQPAWLAARWYRKLVTPQLTLGLLTRGDTAANFELLQLCKPFLRGAEEAWISSWSMIQAPAHAQEGDGVNPRDVLIDPTCLDQSLGVHGHAWLGFRARRRYQIDPKAWLDRWD